MILELVDNPGLLRPAQGALASLLLVPCCWRWGDLGVGQLMWVGWFGGYRICTKGSRNSRVVRWLSLDVLELVGAWISSIDTSSVSGLWQDRDVDGHEFNGWRDDNLTAAKKQNACLSLGLYDRQIMLLQQRPTKLADRSP